MKGRGEATDLFGSERSEALAAILGNIEQTMFGESLYRTREEKAAHLLYFIIKEHPSWMAISELAASCFSCINGRKGYLQA